MSCVDCDPGCSGYGDALENYYPDLEALSEAPWQRRSLEIILLV